MPASSPSGCEDATFFASQAGAAGTRESDLVFRREDGSPVSPDSFSQAFDTEVRRSGLPRIRLHDLRHSHASVWRAGVPVKVISERSATRILPSRSSSTPTSCPACRRRQPLSSPPWSTRPLLSLEGNTLRSSGAAAPRPPGRGVSFRVASGASLPPSLAPLARLLPGRLVRLFCSTRRASRRRGAERSPGRSP
ncbi:MAG: tyrosine-type recombinase/integrase [Acidimicrobiia bacterium]